MDDSQRSILLDALNVFTILWLTGWITVVGKRVINGERHSILFAFIVFYVFFGTPLIMDITSGVPEYLAQPGFRVATRDETTVILYDLYVSVIPLIWWKFGFAPNKKQKETVAKPKVDMSKLYNSTGIKVIRFVLWVVMLMPFITWLFAPDLFVYATYGAAVKRLLSEESRIYHEVISGFCILGVICSAGLMLLRETLTPRYVLKLLPWMVNAIWMQGKRTTVMLGMVVIIYSLWQKGYLRGKKMIIAACMALAFISVFNGFYQSTVKFEDYDSIDETGKYENVRIDYGRDDRVKMTLYAELHPDQIKILEYRGQTALFYMTAFIPRSMWPDKPWPYAVYFTCAMFGLPPGPIGWGMTTSWLEEAIANFGWAGLLIAPLTIAGICRLGDKRDSVMVGALTVLVACLLQAVELVAFAPLVAIWGGALFFTGIQEKRKAKKEKEQEYQAKRLARRSVRQQTIT